MQNDGQLERGAIEEPGGYNNFQARYIIRHPWEGPIECENPQRGIWGGPWPELAAQGASSQPAVARDLAFVERGAVLADYVTERRPSRIAADVGPLPAGPIPAPLPNPRPGLKGGRGGTGKVAGEGGCAHCSTESQPATGSGPARLLGLLGLLGAARRFVAVVGSPASAAHQARRRPRGWLAALGPRRWASALLTAGAPQPAEAFCGFYVAGADAKLYNDATMVVLMRDGQRTVLSMQNDYRARPRTSRW